MARSGQIGNFVNYKQPVPEVGMGVTILSYTDRSAGTIQRISKTGKTIWITSDRAERIDKNGMSESQRYSYTQIPDSKPIRASKRKDGQWRLSGYFGNKLELGVRDAYHDYSF